MPDTETIIAGIAKTPAGIEPSIYKITKNYPYASVECCDSVGYAAIGSGARHVESQFMQAKFHRHFSLPKALFLTYLAKKRSEIAPGVGKETTLFLVGPTLAVNTALTTTIDNKQLDGMYQEILLREKTAAEAAYRKMAELLKDKLQFQPSQYD